MAATARSGPPHPRAGPRTWPRPAAVARGDGLLNLASSSSWPSARRSTPASAQDMTGVNSATLRALALTTASCSAANLRTFSVPYLTLYNSSFLTPSGGPGPSP